MLGSDCYVTSLLDAALVNAMFGKPNEPFWAVAYTSAIRRVRTAIDLAGDPEPDLSEVSVFLSSPESLEALVARALAGPPPAAPGQAPAAPAAGDLSPADRAIERRELDLWYRRDWLVLDSALRASLTAGLASVVSSEIVLRPLPGVPDRSTVRLGSRRGSWNGWDVASLPSFVEQHLRRVAADELPAADCPWSSVPSLGGSRSGIISSSSLPPVVASLVPVLRSAEAVLRSAVDAVRASPPADLGLPSRRWLFADGSFLSTSQLRQSVAALIERALEFDAAFCRLDPGDDGAVPRSVLSGPLFSTVGRAPLSVSGLHIVFVGRLTVPRVDAVRRATAAGARCASALSGRTDLVVLGDVSRASRQHTAVLRAQAAGSVKVLDAEQFLQSCPELRPGESVGSAASPQA